MEGAGEGREGEEEMQYSPRTRRSRREFYRRNGAKHSPPGAKMCFKSTFSRVLRIRAWDQENSTLRQHITKPPKTWSYLLKAFLIPTPARSARLRAGRIPDNAFHKRRPGARASYERPHHTMVSSDDQAAYDIRPPMMPRPPMIPGL